MSSTEPVVLEEQCRIFIIKPTITTLAEIQEVFAQRTAGYSRVLYICNSGFDGETFSEPCAILPVTEYYLTGTLYTFVCVGATVTFNSTSSAWAKTASPTTGGTTVSIGGVARSTLAFDSDPQVQISGKENAGKITIGGVEKTASSHTITIVTNGTTTTLTIVGVT